jgi:hypothetical protein
LPYNRRPIDKRDFKHYEALFANYLDVQKQLNIDELPGDEVKGRFKSFLGKWNRRELSEGWYDPAVQKRAEERFAARPPPAAPQSREIRAIEAEQPVISNTAARSDGSEGEDEDDSDGYGPTLPSNRKAHGVTVPSMQDLQNRRELEREDRETHAADMRYERKQDRNLQKERLEELVPRAAPGTRERQVEKKREKSAVTREFAEAKAPGGVEEVNDADLMGADGVDSYKAQLKVMSKRKNEREIRKEEILRARAAEREERLSEHRQKEAKTMDMLKEMAKQRFG